MQKKIFFKDPVEIHKLKIDNYYTNDRLMYTVVYMLYKKLFEYKYQNVLNQKKITHK